MRKSVHKKRDFKFQEIVATAYRQRDALKLLLELLEKYGPVWYEKRHHDQAKYALNLVLPPKLILVSGRSTDLKRAA